MNVRRFAVAALLFSGLVRGADQSTPPVPVSGNPADSPARVKSGKVFASTDAGLPPALGPVPAKVVVVVFSDFQCPVCRRSADATQQIPEEFPEEVRVEFWQHALSSHSSAENAAVASLAAERQGMFWEYHDEVFRNQPAIDPASLARYAEDLGLDMERFNKDLAAPELRARVKAEGTIAERFGATSTPAFMVNGKVHIGWGSWAGFRSEVERELVEARKLEGEGTPVAQIAELRARTHIEDPALFATYREVVLRVRPEEAKSSKKKKHH
jgi:protein-disulfide isomerase